MPNTRYTPYMDDIQSIAIPAFTPPGSRFSRNASAQMLAYGQQIRDEFLWQYPLLPGAIYIYQQMASEREWKCSGKPRAVARAIEWFNNTQTLINDGTVDYGLEQFLRRRSLDYLAVGRTMFTWGTGGEPLRYLDPTSMTYYLDKKKWVDNFTLEEFDVNRVVVNHPIPIGNTGSFVAPLSFVLPTAMMAWLIREHDRAAADGRKIRDIMVVAGKEFAEQMQDSIVQSLEIYAGFNPTKEGVPLVYIEGLQPGMKVSDLFARIGLANIPDDFNREQFQFQYVNEMATAIGLATRYIWNSEKATNRALEEVQEARQSQKGPAAFVRSDQRLITKSGAMDQFGEDTRFGFIEEVDIASQETNAKVLKLYAEALQIFVQNLGGVINGDALVAWLQRDDILPADLDIITNITTTNPESAPTPVDGNIQNNSDGLTGIQKAVSDVLDYGEVTMTGNGKIIERRSRVFSIEKAIREQIEVELVIESESMNKSLDSFHKSNVLSFDAALKKAREVNLARFKSIMTSSHPIEDEIAKAVFEHIDSLEEDDYRKIKGLLDKQSA